MSKEAFTDAMSSFPTGVTIVTAVDSSGGTHGLTLSAFSSISSEPPLVMVSLMEASNTLDEIRASGEFTVNFLSDDAEPLARRFASKADDKFDGVPVSFRDAGGPVFHDQVCAFVTCTLEQQIRVADHVLLIGRVDEAVTDPTKNPLLYGRRQFSMLPSKDDPVLT